MKISQRRSSVIGNITQDMKTSSLLKKTIDKDIFPYKDELWNKYNMIISK